MSAPALGLLPLGGPTNGGTFTAPLSTGAGQSADAPDSPTGATPSFAFHLAAASRPPEPGAPGGASAAAPTSAPPASEATPEPTPAWPAESPLRPALADASGAGAMATAATPPALGPGLADTAGFAAPQALATWRGAAFTPPASTEAAAHPGAPATAPNAVHAPKAGNTLHAPGDLSAPVRLPPPDAPGANAEALDTPQSIEALVAYLEAARPGPAERLGSAAGGNGTTAPATGSATLAAPVGGSGRAPSPTSTHAVFVADAIRSRLLHDAAHLEAGMAVRVAPLRPEPPALAQAADTLLAVATAGTDGLNALAVDTASVGPLEVWTEAETAEPPPDVAPTLTLPPPLALPAVAPPPTAMPLAAAPPASSRADVPVSLPATGGVALVPPPAGLAAATASTATAGATSLAEPAATTPPGAETPAALAGVARARRDPVQRLEPTAPGDAVANTTPFAVAGAAPADGSTPAASGAERGVARGVADAAANGMAPAAADPASNAAAEAAGPRPASAPRAPNATRTTAAPHERPMEGAVPLGRSSLSDAERSELLAVAPKSGAANGSQGTAAGREDAAPPSALPPGTPDAASARGTGQPAAPRFADALQAAFEAPLSARPGSAAFGPALGVQLSTLVKNGVREARLHLHPAELGPIAVQVALDGTAAQVNLAADHALTRQALEQALPQLAAALRDAGFSFSGGGVSQQGAGQQQRPPADAQQDGAAARGGSQAGAGRTTLAVEGAGDAVAPRASPGRRTGAVDLYA